jgi:hypothetical protein
MQLMYQFQVEFNTLQLVGSVRHDVQQSRNARDGLAPSGVQYSANSSPNHASLVATFGPNGNYHERGVVDSNGVQYSVNILPYNRNVCRTRGEAGQNRVRCSVSARHFDHNHNVGHDAIPITYSPPGLDVSQGSGHGAIPIGYDHPGADEIPSLWCWWRSRESQHIGVCKQPRF